MSRCRDDPTIVILSSFKRTFNKAGYFEITAAEASEELDCPLCRGSLHYRDSRLRRSSDNFGVKTLYLLERLTCTVCGKLHTAIPDFIQPYKHYDSEAIQGVLDGGGMDCVADDSTMRRWRADFAGAKEDITQRLASECAKAQDVPTPICAGDSALTGLRGKNPRWLAFVMKLLINSGHHLFTRFAFCPAPHTDNLSFAGENPGKGVGENDKTVNDTG